MRVLSRKCFLDLNDSIPRCQVPLVIVQYPSVYSSESAEGLLSSHKPYEAAYSLCTTLLRLTTDT